MMTSSTSAAMTMMSSCALGCGDGPESQWCSCLGADGALEEELESLEVRRVYLNSSGQVSCLVVHCLNGYLEGGKMEERGGMERGGMEERRGMEGCISYLNS